MCLTAECGPRLYAEKAAPVDWVHVFSCFALLCPQRSALLLFDREHLAQRAGPIADHGTSGPGHACLQVGTDDYKRWREQLESADVQIVHDHDWGGRRSFYFKDPAGNLLEIADGDLWPSL